MVAERVTADAIAVRRFTADEFERMGTEGIFGDDERLDLIGGEICRMSPVGRFHEVLRSELALLWSRRSTDDIKVVSEMPLKLSDEYWPVADIGVFAAPLLSPDVRVNSYSEVDDCILFSHVSVGRRCRIRIPCARGRALR